MFFDTHVHFDGLGAESEKGAALERAVEADVARMIAVGGSPEGNVLAVEAAGLDAVTAFSAVGYDRYCATRDVSMEDLDSLLDHRDRVVAVGEIGLDFHYEPATRDQQKALFEKMLEKARKRLLPVIVHSRESEEETLTILADHVKRWEGASDRIGVLHCFTGEQEFAKRVLDLGFYVSFSGILTFRNAASIREAARIVPDDRLLIETDSPYLAPVPMRGKKNEPAFVRYVAETLAQVRGCPVERVAELTSANANRLFGLHD
jgi:TatD DNase family protein